MRYLICFLLLCGAIAAYGQSAQQLTEEGMKLADAGDYKSAVAKYDAALKSDPAWLSAKSEKAVALYFLGKYQEAADLCKQALAQHKGSKELKAVYITYGNCLDELGQPKNALKVYKEGMKKFPDSYLLPFNSGLTYISLKAYDDAQEMFQKAILINPEHAGSHYYLGMTMEAMGKKIPATLALLRFLLLEHEGSKSDKALPYVLKKIKGNAARSTDGTINITIDESSMDKDKKDNFSTVDLLLSLSAAYDFDEKNKDKSELELFVQKFDVMVTAMDEQKKEGKGFFWEYYVPFFTDMKKQGHLETFCYVLYGYREGTNEEVEQWMAANQNRLQSFVLWAGAYPWPKELK
ncbi:MAG: tetratricopeptide repeat protein [Bacteroidota bacterium]